jgi:hypothetical protein
MEAAINAFAAILREMDARISALEATKKQENPAPAPAPVTEEPSMVADQPSEERFPLDNYGPDWIQDYLTPTITAATDAGRTFVFVSEATYRRVIGNDPAPRPDGTVRNFKNATGGQVDIVLPGVADPLLILQPGETGSLVFTENAWKNPTAPQPITEVVTNLDNYGPDWVQDSMFVLINEITDAGKTAVFTYEQDYPHQAFCDSAPRPDGTTRSFRNAGVAPLKIRLHGVWQTLLILQPGESGSIFYTNGRWNGRDMYPDAWSSLPTGGYTAIRRVATEEEQATFATEGALIEIIGPDNEPINMRINYVWYEAPTGKIGAACNNDRFFISCDPATVPMLAATYVLISEGGVDPSDAAVTFRVPIA